MAARKTPTPRFNAAKARVIARADAAKAKNKATKSAPPIKRGGLGGPDAGQITGQKSPGGGGLIKTTRSLSKPGLHPSKSFLPGERTISGAKLTSQLKKKVHKQTVAANKKAAEKAAKNTPAGGSKNNRRGNPPARNGSPNGGGPSRSRNKNKNKNNNKNRNTTTNTNTSTTPTTPTNDKTDLAKANRSVDLQLNPTLNEYLRQIDAAKSGLTSETNQINTASGRTQSDLGAIYERLGNYLNGVNGMANQNMTDSNNSVKSMYDNLIANQQSMGQATQGAAGSELQRMGLTGATSMNPLQNDASLLTGLAQTNQANASATGQQAQSNAQMLQALLGGGVQTEGASQKSTALRAAQDAIAQAQRAGNQNISQLQGQYGETQSKRGSMLQEMLDTIAQTRYEQTMEQNQQGFENSILQGKLGLQQAELTNQSNYQQGQLKETAKERRARMRIERQKLADKTAERANQNEQNALDRLTKLQTSASQGTYKPTGIAGAMDLVQKTARTPNEASKIQAILRTVQNQGRTRHHSGAQYDSSNYGNYGRILKITTGQLKNWGIDSTVNRRILADALSAFFGKYGGT